MSGVTELQAVPATSIVIEWENITVAEGSRGKQMLSRLRWQLCSLEEWFESEPEVLLLYDPDEVNEADVKQVVSECLNLSTDDPFTVEIIASRDADYYAHKNRGARQANGEIVVFLDSDVIPEDEWLKNLVQPFKDPTVNVVAGHTHMSTDSLYEQAFQLFWFFPTRTHDPVTGFFANNVAFRRELFLQYGFPELRTYRGQCDRLHNELQREGIGILQQPDAVCTHPPPNGVLHFVFRALYAGYDTEVSQRQAGKSATIRLFSTAGVFLNNLLTIIHRIVARRTVPEVRDDLSVVVAALVLGFVYCTLELAGQVLTFYDPHILGQRIEN